MKNVKLLIIVVIAVLLVASLVYLTLLIQDSSNPLGMFGIRASNPSDEIDPFLSENGAGDTSPVVPSPTEVLMAYNSTSPTASPSGAASISATLAVSKSPSPTISITPTPTIDPAILETSIPTPTIIQSLPVSGVTDNINKFLIGGGVLILLGLLL